MVALDVMPFDRSLWREAFVPDKYPRFACPTCYWSHAGKLAAKLSDLHVETPTHIAQLPWETSKFGGRFRLTMRCDAVACGEVVLVVGDVCPWEMAIDGQKVNYAEALFPAYFFPAPPIIAASGAQDGHTGLLLHKSFELFWVEPESGMNCVRRIIEGTLDNFGVPKTFLTKAGNERRTTLINRIDVFLSTDEHVAESLMALRKIGNIGSHGGEINREMVLDAYELLDDCMRHLYDLSPVQKLELQVSSHARVEALRAKLRDLDG